MEIPKFALTGTAVAGVAFVIGLITPQRLGSQYASPVNIMNSKAAPAMIRDTDNAARTPYQSTMGSPACNPNCIFPSVPANKRLVITHFDAQVLFNVGQDPLSFMGITNSSSSATAIPEFSAIPPFAGINVYTSSRAVEFYLDAGDSPVAFFGTINGNVAPGFVTLSGHLVDCTNGCAPIAH